MIVVALVWRFPVLDRSHLARPIFDVAGEVIGVLGVLRLADADELIFRRPARLEVGVAGKPNSQTQPVRMQTINGGPIDTGLPPAPEKDTLN